MVSRSGVAVDFEEGAYPNKIFESSLTRIRTRLIRVGSWGVTRGL